MCKSYCIVTPHQGPPFSDVALLSLRRSSSVLATHRWILALPDNTDLAPYRVIHPNIEARYFPSHYFESKRSAQLFYMHPDFFGEFTDFDYILIHQLDVYVFEDQLEYWVNFADQNNLDYIGAPWLNHQWLHFAKNPLARLPWQWLLNETVGSGGFSLRKVKTCLDACSKNRFVIENILKHFIPEDIYWCQLAQYMGSDIRRPSARDAARFAFETECQKCLEWNGGKLPFAAHGWNRHEWDFWRPIIPGSEAIYEELSSNGVKPL